jgi:transcriptional regulator with XRE-family HTH domain
MKLLNAAMTGVELITALATIGWSQRELARRLGIDEATVRRWARSATPVPRPVAAWLRQAAAWHAAHPPPQPV